VALRQAACRAALRVRFFTAAELVSQLEKARNQYTLDQILGQLERAHLLICDELGFVSLSRGGVELLFRVFGDRYERASVLMTTNLPFSEWNQIFRDQRRELPLSRVDEIQEGPENGVKTKLPLLPGGSF
jgi:DNA replication protein DnaC